LFVLSFSGFEAFIFHSQTKITKFHTISSSSSSPYIYRKTYTKQSTIMAHTEDHDMENAAASQPVNLALRSSSNSANAPSDKKETTTTQAETTQTQKTHQKKKKKNESPPSNPAPNPISRPRALSLPARLRWQTD
jgi:hypothetical protein